MTSIHFRDDSMLYNTKLVNSRHDILAMVLIIQTQEKGMNRAG